MKRKRKMQKNKRVKVNLIKQYIRSIMLFTNNEFINFVIKSDGKTYDLTPVFSAFLILFEDKYRRDNLFSSINYCLTEQLDMCIDEEFVESSMEKENFDDVIKLINISQKGVDKVIGDNFFENSKYAYLVDNYMDKKYKIYLDRSLQLYTLKLSLCFKKCRNYNSLPVSLIYNMLDMLHTASIYKKNGKSIDEILDKVKLSFVHESGKKFFNLVLCSYIMLGKKYGNRILGSYSDSFERLLLGYADYSEFLDLLKDSYKKFGVRKVNASNSADVGDVFDAGDKDAVDKDVGDKDAGDKDAEDNENKDDWYAYKMLVRDVVLRVKSIYSNRVVLLYKKKMREQEMSFFNKIKEYKSSIRKSDKTHSKLKEVISKKDKEIKKLEERLKSFNNAEKEKELKNKIENLGGQLEDVKNENKVVSNKLSSALNRVKTLEDREENKMLLEYTVEEQKEEIERLEAIIDSYEKIDENINNISLEEIKEFIRDKKFLFLGGPIGFDKRLESVFDNFVYIEVSDKSSGFTIPDNLDCAVIMCRKVNHGLVNRLEASIKNQKVAIIRTGMTNLELLLRCIYEKLGSH